MNTKDHNHCLPAAVQGQLQAVRRLLRTYVTAQTLLLIACWLLCIFWAGAFLDYLPVRAGSNETPRWLRMTMLAAMGLGSLWILLRWTLPRLLTPVRSRSLALLIERLHPELNNELVTAVELASRDETDVSNPVAHQAMLDRVLAASARDVLKIAPSELFNWQPIWASSTAVVFGILITAVTAIGMPDWLGLWAKRLFTLSDDTWPRAAELRADGIQLQFPSFTGQLAARRVTLPFDSSVVRVPSGSTAVLQISANAQAKRVPEVCTLFYRSADGGRGRANLRRVGSPRDGWQQFTLDGPPLDSISQNISLDVVGLDARLRDLQLQVVEPAVVADMRLECHYPSYLLDSFSSRPAQEQLAYRAGMRIPAGTFVSLVGQASSQLNSVEYVVRAPAGDESTLNEVAIQRLTPTGAQFTIPLGELLTSQIVEVRLIDEYGLSSDQILRYVISISEDTPPVVESRLDGIGIAVTPRALLPIRGRVEDDNGVKQVEAELALNDVQPLSIPLQVSRDGELQTDVDLEKLATADQLPLAAGMTLGLVVTARDYFDLNEQTHVGRGLPQQLAVVTEDQLLVILDRQELELRERLELIISELQEVNAALELLGSSLENPPKAAGGWQTSRRAVALVVVQNGAEANQDEIETVRAQLRRMAVLRAQQSLLQCDKSEQELVGVAQRAENIRLQLLNNRIDSYDHQNRLQTKVHQPLLELLDGDYLKLNRSLVELQTATMSGQGFEQTTSAISALNRVIDTLESIKANLRDIESFNEIVDLVRTLLEDQQGLLNETEKQQKARILELLK